MATKSKHSHVTKNKEGVCGQKGQTELKASHHCCSLEPHYLYRKRSLSTRSKVSMGILVIPVSETHQIQSVSINPSNWPPALVCIIVLCAISNIAGMVASGTAGKGGRNKRQSLTPSRCLPLSCIQDRRMIRSLKCPFLLSPVLLFSRLTEQVTE